MDEETNKYPKTPENSVNRYKHQANYDANFIHTLINTTSILHISFVPDPSTLSPVILPMIGQMGQYPGPDPSNPTPSPWACYLHGYVSSRLMNLASPGGLPVCVSATKVDGFVLSLTPYSHNYNYRSAILHGHAHIVVDTDEMLWAMKLITDSVIPGRWENTRVPPTGAELQSTRILKVVVDSASGKVREGGPEDEKGDLKDRGVMGRVWTGVVPVWEQMGPPQEGGYNEVKKVPEYVEEAMWDGNERAERYAVEAAWKEAPKKLKKREDEEVKE